MNGQPIAPIAWIVDSRLDGSNDVKWIANLECQGPPWGRASHPTRDSQKCYLRASTYPRIGFVSEEFHIHSIQHMVIPLMFRPRSFPLDEQITSLTTPWGSLILGKTGARVGFLAMTPSRRRSQEKEKNRKELPDTPCMPYMPTLTPQTTPM